MRTAAQRLVVTNANDNIVDIIRDYPEEQLGTVINMVQARYSLLKRERRTAERIAELAPWKDEAKRWKKGQKVFVGKAWCYTNMNLADLAGDYGGADIPTGQRAEVFSIHRDGVYLKFPKKIKVDDAQRAGNLQWVKWSHIYHYEVSRVPMKERGDSFKK